jgi:hypothetical protein
MDTKKPSKPFKKPDSTLRKLEAELTSLRVEIFRKRLRAKGIDLTPDKKKLH